MKTQAVYQVEPYKLEIRELDVPDPRRDEVQVECLANGICMAEVHVHKGIEVRNLPRIPGHEGIGVVVKAGPEAEGLAEGDTVTCTQWARHYNYKASRLARFSKRPADPAVMLAEPVECAVRAIDSYRIVPGDRVLVIGAGFMGQLNIQGLARCPLTELVAVDPKPKALQLADSFGATRLIRPDTSQGRAELAEFRETRPFDLVVECAGLEETIAEADRYARKGGRLSIFAWHHGERTVDMGRWHLSGLKVLNSAPMIGTDSAINYLDRAVRLMERSVFDQRRLVTHRHAFEAVAEAMELACRRDAEYIKGVLTF
jgi:threonine dehydrogenase-like Zn-dependent dehydrogenase